MSKTPDKIVLFSDVHFGLRNNERRHNNECEDFIKWMISEAHSFGADTCMFLGDWHHYRSSVQTSTLNYSISAFKLLSESFEHYYHIVGNHDLFYKDKREIHSVEFAKEHSNITLVNDFVRIGDILLCPWLVGDEWKKLKKETSPYIFGHFEFPSFYMNAMVQMPDLGKINADMFCTPGQTVLSGHFHKRQIVENAFGVNIGYIGNCFPHSYSDAGDDDRGIVLLEVGKPLVFKKWPHAPKFRQMTLSQVLKNPERHLDHLTNLKLQIDTDLSYEETKFIRDLILNDFEIRELKMIPMKTDNSDLIDQMINNFHSVDQTVIEQLSSLPMGSMNPSLLIDIYNNLG